MFIVKNRNIFFGITASVIIAAIASVALFGLHLGIDFTGGTLVQMTYEGGRPAPQVLEASLDSAGFSGYSLREAGESDYILRTANLTEEQRSDLPSILSIGGTNPATVDHLTEVGPTIGTELRNKSLIALVLVLVFILLFIAFAFRKVSKPVSSWAYGFIALVALLHDMLIPVGFYAVLGHFTGAQIDSLFVTAVLTVLGFSIHDTIVVFDRVRENLRINQDKGRKEDFADTAGRSVSQTLTRSINTSLTTLFALLALYLLGPAATQDFALTLLVGIIAGTYSSIALATPLLVVVEKWRGKHS
ncbi:MAG: protein translocase subunit SecF [Patescibacteria group bacterium]|nr:protein translocase subunit SecF [Patescibacteria group bacterium]